MEKIKQKFGQGSIVFQKPGILSENVKTLTTSNYPRVQYFWLKLRTRFLLTIVYKKVCWNFLLYLDLGLFRKIKKRPGFYTLVFYTFINNSRSKENFKNPTHRLWKISAKNIKIYGSSSSSKFSIFQTKKPGFLEMIEVCLNLGIRFCITWSVLPNYKKISP